MKKGEAKIDVNPEIKKKNKGGQPARKSDKKRSNILFMLFCPGTPRVIAEVSMACTA
jgi:hypothetical protein